jgi:hypothetical protein
MPAVDDAALSRRWQFAASRFSIHPIKTRKERESLCTLFNRIICKTGKLQSAVIPAKAGIHFADLLKRVVYGLDSRFRGNDRCFSRGPVPNGTNTRP